MNFKSLIALSFPIIMFCSCGKEYVMNCDINIVTSKQLLQSGAKTSSDEFLTYVLHADTTDYTVVSYSDAVNGVFTNRKSNEKLDFSAEGVYDKDLKAFAFNELTEPDNILLIVDTTNAAYAYKYQEIVGGLLGLHLNFNMPVWKFAPTTDNEVGLTEFTQDKWEYRKDEK